MFCPADKVCLVVSILLGNSPASEFYMCRRFGTHCMFHLHRRVGGYELSTYLMFIGPCIIVIVEEWKTNLMSLATLFHFLCAQHVSEINITIIRSLRLCCWITTSVVLFCKDGWFSFCVNLRCTVACVWCDVFCRYVVVGRCILIDIDRYLLCFVIIVFENNDHKA